MESIKFKIMLNTIDKVKRFGVISSVQNFDMDLSSDRYTVDAKSILGIFSLDLTKAMKLTIYASKDDAKDFLNQISALIIEET